MPLGIELQNCERFYLINLLRKPTVLDTPTAVYQRNLTWKYFLCQLSNYVKADAEADVIFLIIILVLVRSTFFGRIFGNCHGEVLWRVFIPKNVKAFLFHCRHGKDDVFVVLRLIFSLLFAEPESNLQANIYIPELGPLNQCSE
jgi:hypothetical protein